MENDNARAHEATQGGPRLVGGVTVTESNGVRHYGLAPDTPSPGNMKSGVGMHPGARTAHLPQRIRAGQTYLYHGRGFHQFGVARYRWPAGYAFHRYNVGMILPATFLNAAYLIADWTYFGLDAPPPGFVWYRYGSDALLLNGTTGYIQSEISGMFSDAADGNVDVDGGVNGQNQDAGDGSDQAPAQTEQGQPF